VLFNSYSFIFVFLPVTLLGFLAVNRLHSRKLSLAWLVLCSMTFYGIWNPANLYVILPSIAVNYAFALGIKSALQRGESGERLATLLTVVGVVANVCFLGYFKYKNFFIESVNDVFGTQWLLYSVFLPLGISFITFQKIAFLLDIRSGTIQRFDLFDFLVFVFFFPQLIAGPIVHYREMMPQFEKLDSRLNLENIAIGLCPFAMGSRR
jgi:alginate O-acetyltransferase complex protein AlgI